VALSRGAGRRAANNRLIAIGNGGFDQRTFMAEVTFEDTLAKPPAIAGCHLQLKAQSLGGRVNHRSKRGSRLIRGPLGQVHA
jgi:hypothetical protein